MVGRIQNEEFLVNVIFNPLFVIPDLPALVRLLGECKFYFMIIYST
jgi:hypothetical protein